MNRIRLSTVTIWCFLALIPVTSCQDPPGDPQQEIRVAAAVSLKSAMRELGAQFEASRGVKVLYNFASSNTLQRQIENGAPADVYVSAAPRHMDVLEERRLIDAASRRNIASNRMVLIGYPAENNSPMGFEHLRDERIARVALGGAGVPVGLYGQEILVHLRIWDTVRDKGVFGQNALQVVQYVARGEVDAGIVYATDAALVPGVVTLAMADAGWHTPIVYPAAIVSDNKVGDLAEDFLDHISGAAGRDILGRFGFTTLVGQVMPE